MFAGCFFIDFLGPRFLTTDIVGHIELPEEKKSPNKKPSKLKVIEDVGPDQIHAEFEDNHLSDNHPDDHYAHHPVQLTDDHHDS